MTLLDLAPSLIELDPDLQPRAEMDAAVIEDYAQAMRDGTEFPPVVVYLDAGTYWLADGFHRVYAAVAAGQETISADVSEGGRRDALLYSVGANAAHGLRRTNADKRRAVERLLRDGQWRKWNDSQIARAAGVSHEFVRGLRPAILQRLQDAPPEAPRLVERNGTVYEMRTEAIGRSPRHEARGPYPSGPTLADVAATIPPGDDAHSLLLGPEQESSESKALRRLVIVAGMRAWDPEQVASQVETGDDAERYRRTCEEFAPWLGRFADALRRREGARLRLVRE